MQNLQEMMVTNYGFIISSKELMVEENGSITFLSVVVVSQDAEFVNVLPDLHGT